MQQGPFDRASCEAALVHILCAGGESATIPPPMTREGVVGLFSQLNQFAQAVLMSAYAGRSPASPASIQRLLEATTLVGYGGGSLAEHFTLSFSCNAPRQPRDLSSAVDVLRRTPRFTVVGTLFHLLLTPRHPPKLLPVVFPSAMSLSAIHPPVARFDLAVHIRRGDRLWVDRAVEKIEVWPPERLLQQMLLVLGSELASAAAGGGKPRVLLASDDNDYLDRLAGLSYAAGLSVFLIPNPDARLEAGTNRSLEAAKVCGGACVANALSVLDAFARADRLMLSSKSNLGGYILSWWGAANPSKLAPDALFDLDKALRRETLPRRYFCELPWGSRHGLCASGQSACDMPQFAGRSFCAAKGAAKGAAGATKGAAAKGAGRGAGGKGKGSGAKFKGSSGRL